MEAGQRGLTRYGVPRIAADASPGGRDRVACGEARGAQSHRGTRPARSRAGRGTCVTRIARRSSAAGVCASTAHAASRAVPQPARTASLFRLRAAGGRASEVSGESQRAGDCVSGVVERTTALEAARPLPRLEQGSARAQRAPAGVQHALSDSALGTGAALGLAHSGTHGEDHLRRLASALRASDLLVGDVRRYLAVRGHMLSRRQLAIDRHDSGTRPSRADVGANTSREKDAGFALTSQVPGDSPAMKRPRVNVNLEELDQIIDRGTHAPLSPSEGEKLKGALHALAGMLPQPRSTEKTKAVLGQIETPAPKNETEPVKGHGRNGASSYTGAKKVVVPHPTMKPGDPCPGCKKGKVYPQKESRVLVRIVGQAPLAGTVYELDRLRCNLCGEVFTAPEPEGIGLEKYDETTAAMIALLKYGSGMPFYRLEKLEDLLGIPLPASTQWEIVDEAAEVIKAARDELIRQAAQGEVLHNDDTSMRVLRLAREPSDDRTGVFTSGIVSTQQGRRIALYFTGRQHAGENLRDVLEHRTADLARPLQMCDAQTHNTPTPPAPVEILRC